jgi:nicotinamidase-related amidase
VLGRGRDFYLIEKMMGILPSVIKTANDANVLTLYTQQIYDPNKLNSLQKEQYALDGKLITCNIDTDGYKFFKINPPQEDVYVKYNFNAFSNLEFQNRLDKNNIKTLVITGVDTQFCVETAVRNGYDLGYKIVVVEDCVATNAKNVEFQNNTLALIRKSYGVVINSLELKEIWKIQ